MVNFSMLSTRLRHSKSVPAIRQKLSYDQKTLERLEQQKTALKFANLHKIVELELEQVGRPLLTLHRVYIRQDPTRCGSTRYTILLFNDLMVVGPDRRVVAQKRDLYDQQRLFSFWEPLHVSKLEKTSIQIVGTCEMVLDFESDTMRDEWINTFDMTRETFEWKRHQSSMRAMEQGMSPIIMEPDRWVPDDQVSTCMVCNETRFSLFIRRHHCRSCGKVICYECSEFHLDGKAMIRFCVSCLHRTQ
jgi:hypothetical protein